MDRDIINSLLKEVIQEAQELNIPVPVCISNEIIINPRPKKRFGCCRKKGKIFQIEISEFMLQCSINKIKQTIAHEVIHTCPGCYDHGKEWKKYAELMNQTYGYRIKRVSSLEEMGIRESENDKKYRYIIKCMSCNKEYPRQRKSEVIKNIKRYRCSCGGRLEVLR